MPSILSTIIIHNIYLSFYYLISVSVMCMICCSSEVDIMMVMMVMMMEDDGMMILFKLKCML